MKVVVNSHVNSHGIAATRATFALLALTLACATVFVPLTVRAQDASAGNLGAAIRESGSPCAHVIEAQQTSANPPTYTVRCNSGTFNVVIKDDGTAEVTQAN